MADRSSTGRGTSRRFEVHEGGKSRKSRRAENEAALRGAIVAASFLMIFLLSWSLVSGIRSSLSGRFVQTATAQRGYLEVAFRGTGTLIREEQVFVTPIDGVVKAAVAEGERVPRGTLVAEVVDPSLAGDVSRLKEGYDRAVDAFIIPAALKLRELETRVRELEIQLKIAEDDLAARRRAGSAERAKEAERAVARIRQDLERAKADRRKLEAELRSQAAQVTAAGGDVSRLMSRAFCAFVAPAAGIVSYSTDGLEETLVPGRFDLSAEKLRSLTPMPVQVKPGQTVKAGDRVARHINNFVLYVAVELEASDMVAMKEGRRVRVRFPEFSTQLVEGTVEKVIPPDATGFGVAVISLGRYATTLTSVRRTQTEVVVEVREGVLIPRSALVERDGKTGVYQVVGGEVRFKEVEVEALSETQAAVSGLSEGTRVVKSP